MSTKCASEKILKIGQYLTKIWTITKWDVFFETQCIITTTTPTTTPTSRYRLLMCVGEIAIELSYSFLASAKSPLASDRRPFCTQSNICHFMTGASFPLYNKDKNNLMKVGIAEQCSHLLNHRSSFFSVESNCM